MNAGYMGYYDGRCRAGGLTSTVFEIYNDRVEIARYSYSKNSDGVSVGVSNLKEAGVWNNAHRRGSFTEEKNNTTVYESKQTVELNLFYDPVYTGDAAQMGINAVLMVGSLAVCGCVILIAKRRKISA